MNAHHAGFGTARPSERQVATSLRRHRRLRAINCAALSDEVRNGRFRHDLPFRLDVVRIAVPPLRDRPEDIAPMALLFWTEAILPLAPRTARRQ